jgi:hypothetical protein
MSIPSPPKRGSGRLGDSPWKGEVLEEKARGDFLSPFLSTKVPLRYFPPITSIDCSIMKRIYLDTSAYNFLADEKSVFEQLRQKVLERKVEVIFSPVVFSELIGTSSYVRKKDLLRIAGDLAPARCANSFDILLISEILHAAGVMPEVLLFDDELPFSSDWANYWPHPENAIPEGSYELMEKHKRLNLLHRKMAVKALTENQNVTEKELQNYLDEAASLSLDDLRRKYRRANGLNRLGIDITNLYAKAARALCYSLFIYPLEKWLQGDRDPCLDYFKDYLDSKGDGPQQISTRMHDFVQAAGDLRILPSIWIMATITIDQLYNKPSPGNVLDAEHGAYAAYSDLFVTADNDLAHVMFQHAGERPFVAEPFNLRDSPDVFQARLI